ncbi:MAG TPA: hypothetical protein VM490_16945 [Armatimonadaceae bacterium]|nr:hypothetical protein [Armatimonadaceae bacterium]
MNPLRTAALFVLLVAAAGSAPPRAAHAQNIPLVTNGGFESGFSGWTVANQLGSEGTFFIQSGTASPVNGFPVPAPPQGTNAAMTDAEAGGSHVLYQDFLVPTNAVGGSVNFSLYWNSGANFVNGPGLDWAATSPVGGSVLNQQIRVDILLAGSDPFSVAPGAVLQNLFQTTAASPLESGYNNFTLDTSGLFAARAGQTLRLRFAEVDNVSFLNLGVDAVSVVAVVPEPGAVATVGVMLGALGLGLARGRVRRRAKGGGGTPLADAA